MLTGGHHFAANLVLQDTVERIYAGKLYADIQRGIFIVRGENVLLLGEVVCHHYQALPRLSTVHLEFVIIAATDDLSRTLTGKMRSPLQ